MSSIAIVVDTLNIRSSGDSPDFLETPNQIYGAIDNFLSVECLDREKREVRVGKQIPSPYCLLTLLACTVGIGCLCYATNHMKHLNACCASFSSPCSKLS